MNLTHQEFKITSKQRQQLNGHKPLTIWMSGLSGSGKSTIANLLETKLNESGLHTYILDGDNTRLGLNKDLGFSEKDREENIRRVAEVCKLMNDAGLIVICSFISPFESGRKSAQQIVGDDKFVQVFIDTDLEVCESRDPKGLYKKARLGEIKEFTGISSPFEIPVNSLNLINNTRQDLDSNVNTLFEIIKNKV